MFVEKEFNTWEGLEVDRIEIDYDRDRIEVFYQTEAQKAEGVRNPVLSTVGPIPLKMVITKERNDN